MMRSYHRRLPFTAVLVASLLASLLAACGGPATQRVDEPPTADETPATPATGPSAGPAATPPGDGGLGGPAAPPTPAGGADGLVADAREAVAEGRYDQAERALLEATGLHPSDTGAQRLLAQVRMRTGDLTGARQALDRAWSDAEGDKETLRLLVQLDVRERKPAAAERILDEAIAATPEDLELHALRHWVWLQEGRAREVIEATRDLLRKDETNVPLMVALADAYRLLNQFELAEYVLRNALQVREMAAVHQGLAEIAAARGEPKLALYHSQKAVELEPDFTEALNNLGIAYHWAGDDAAAVEVLARATRLAPSFAKAYVNLGNAYRRMRQFREAEDAYRRALEIEPKLAAAWYNLGILYFETTSEDITDERRFTQAVDTFNRYKELIGADLPKDDPVDKYIAEARLVLEELEKSRSEQPEPVAEPPETDPSEDGAPPDGGDGGAEEALVPGDEAAAPSTAGASGPQDPGVVAPGAVAPGAVAPGAVETP